LRSSKAWASRAAQRCSIDSFLCPPVRAVSGAAMVEKLLINLR